SGCTGASPTRRRQSAHRRSSLPCSAPRATSCARASRGCSPCCLNQTVRLPGEAYRHVSSYHHTRRNDMDTLDPSDSLALFRLLAHDLRCHLVRSLAQSDARVSELAARVGEAPETIVSELERLRSAGLVTERQSDAPSR